MNNPLWTALIWEIDADHAKSWITQSIKYFDYAVRVRKPADKEYWLDKAEYALEQGIGEIQTLIDA